MSVYTFEHAIFRRGGGALALDDVACDPLLFQKGGIFSTKK